MPRAPRAELAALAATPRRAPPTTPPEGHGTRGLARRIPSRPHRIRRRSPSPSATHHAHPEPHQASAGTPAPLTWTADSHTLGLTSCGEDYVVAKPPQQVPPPPHPEDIAAWATSQRAVHAGTTGVRVTVQGRGSAAVVLEALHVRVVNRAAPAAGRGIVYSLGDGCGAGITPRFFSVNLDAYQPVARSLPGDNGVGTPIPAIGFPYRVSLQEPEVLVVSARTESCTCDWYLDLTWSSQGRTGTVRIDDHGRPFRSTSTKGLPGYRYDRISYRPGRWVPIPAANLGVFDAACGAGVLPLHARRGPALLHEARLVDHESPSAPRSACRSRWPAAQDRPRHSAC